MGCLPVMLLLVVGFGVGYAIDGRGGAVVGAGIGLLLGAVAGIALMHLLRGRRG